MTMFALMVLCVALHELAHALTAENLGLRVKRVVFGWRGVGVVRAAGEPWQNFLVALAGPAMSALLAWIFWPWVPKIALGNMLFASVCLLQSNPKSDGSRAMCALREMKLW
jgi:hypothetical protein